LPEFLLLEKFRDAWRGGLRRGSPGLLPTFEPVSLVRGRRIEEEGRRKEGGRRKEEEGRRNEEGGRRRRNYQKGIATRSIPASRHNFFFLSSRSLYSSSTHPDPKALL
jgi:hypothetical protein